MGLARISPIMRYTFFLALRKLIAGGSGTLLFGRK